MDNMNFIELLQKFDCILIPKIQRDYAQGRTDVKATDVRNNFLDDIFSGRAKNLDFIFGTCGTTAGGNCFIPIDGQQRLTTLFLLHLYENKKVGNNYTEELKKFSYDTRRASKDFCKAITENSWNIDKKPSEVIKNAVWFMDYWQYDPTVASMLNMLDAIQEKANNADFPELDEIKFLFFDMNNHNLNENLYLKMNSRGKPLTTFENLKSAIEELLEEKENGKLKIEHDEKAFEQETAEDKEVSGKDFISKWKHHIDRGWTEWFWENEKSSNNTIDKPFTQFICRFLAGYQCIYATDKGIEEKFFKKKCEEVKEDTFVDFSFVKEALRIDGAFESIAKVLMGFALDWKEKTKSNWNNEITNNEITKIDEYKYLAVIQGFLIGKDRTDANHWLRFCWNMAENYVTGADTYLTFCGYLRELKQENDLYSALKKYKTENINIQLQEEIKKATQIKEGKKEDLPEEASDWELAIIEAENYAFFKGAIRFLFTDANGKMEDWRNFATKWKNAKNYFAKDGKRLNPDWTNDKLLKALISRQTNFWSTMWWSYTIFNNSVENWRGLLLNANWQNPIHYIMLGDTTPQINNEENIKPLLEDDLMKYILEKQPYAWIRNSGNFHALWTSRYPSYKIVLNNILHDLVKCIPQILKYENPIGNSGYAKGIDGCIDFIYKKDNKDYHFRWQNSNWIDMYEGDKNIWDGRALDITLEKTEMLHTHFKSTSDEQEPYFADSNSLINELNRCIKKYEEIKNQGNPPTVP